MEYIQGSPIPNDINEFVGDKYYSPLFGINVTCAQYNSTADVCDQYVKKDYWFAILTLFFIYLPSVNVIATLYGPRTAGAVGIRMSPGMAGYVGGSFALYCYTARLSELSSPADSIIGWLGWFILILSSGFLGMALVNFFSKGYFNLHTEFSFLHYIMFIPLVSISPAIFIVIKFLAIFKSGNTLLQSQTTYGSRGRAFSRRLHSWVSSCTSSC